MTTKDKIITSISIIGILIMTCYLQSCATNQQLAHKYNQKVECYDFTKQIQ